MALFQKEDKTPRPDDFRIVPPPPPLTSSPSFESTAAGEFQANLGHGSRVEGRLSFEGSVRIDGHIDGEISAQETVIVGENAVVAAQIQANTVIVQGRVTGDITARKRVELRAPAKLIGNISTPSLVINEGVTFEGHCTMGSAEARSEKGDKKVAIFPKSSDVAS
jgi:cytoskeletal protein CcmA (bactofilin family)